MSPYVKLKDMPPLHQFSYDGPLIPVSGDSASVVTLPTEEMQHRLFALHAVSQFMGERHIRELTEAARFVETGDVLTDDDSSLL